MEERYKKMSKLGVRNIDGYNVRLAEAKAKGETLIAHRAHRLRQGIRRGDLREGGARPRAAALHRRHRRRDGRPDDGRRQGHRRRGAAPRADGARRRHPRHPGDAAPVGRRHHRHHQGELPDPHLLPGHLQDRQPHHPGRAGRRAAARPGRHALHGGRRPHQPRARPVLLRRRGREGRPPPQVAGPAAISRSRHRGRGGGRRGRQSGVRRHQHGRDRRRHRPLPAGGADRDPRQKGLDQLHPAPAADRLQPRRLAHGADGEGRHRRPGQPRRKARNPGWPGRARSGIENQARCAVKSRHARFVGREIATAGA